MILDRFIQIICAAFDITEDEIKSKNRDEILKFARFFFFMYARKHTSFSWKRIAKEVNRDHATAMHGNRRIKEILSILGYTDLIEKNKLIEREIELILAKKEQTIQEQINELEFKINILKKELCQTSKKE